MRKQETIQKPINFPKDLAINIQAMADLEERNFGSQVRQLVKEAMNNRQIQK